MYGIIKNTHLMTGPVIVGDFKDKRDTFIKQYLLRQMVTWHGNFDDNLTDHYITQRLCLGVPCSHQDIYPDY